MALRAVPVAVLALVLATASTAAEQLVDGIAAQVGGDVVLISEVNQMAAPVEERMRDAGAPEVEVGRMRADVLDRLIEARLMAEVVRRLELTATDAEVDEAISGIARDTGISVDQLERSVASHGLNMDEYRAKIRDEIERSKVLNSMVRSRVRIENHELRSMYVAEFSNQPTGGEEVHLRQLLVAFGPQFHRDMDTACAAAEDARERIGQGQATFPAVAREVSDANASRGGDLGWIHESELAGWMADVVDDLGEGGLSDVIKTRYGCNLLELVGRRQFQPVTFDQVKEQLERRLMRQKMEVAYAEWVETLRAQTYIERKGVFRESASVGDLP